MRAGVRSPRAIAGKVNFRDLALGALVVGPLLLLLLPLVPYPGDHDTVIRVWFRAEGARIAHKFSLPMSAGVCSEVRYALSDRDSATGTYTKVRC